MDMFGDCLLIFGESIRSLTAMNHDGFVVQAGADTCRRGMPIPRTLSCIDDGSFGRRNIRSEVLVDSFAVSERNPAASGFASARPGGGE